MIGINVYDEGIVRIGTIETWISMIWDEEYRDEGRFQLEIWHSAQAARLLREGVFCGIQESRTLAVITGVVAEGKKLIYSGTMAVGMLKDRTSTRRVFEENAENAMREIVGAMEPYPPIALGKSAGLKDVFTPEIRDLDVLEYARQIAAETDIGFILAHDKAGKRLLFECYKPEENPNARYATAYGNLGDLKYSRSGAEYKNVAVIVNTYSETKDDVTTENRIVLYAGATQATGSERREMMVTLSKRPEKDETDEDFRARLIAEGEAALIDHAKIENIQFEVSDERTHLGDVITALLPELNAMAKVRVIGVSITSQNNKTTREISVGTPILLRKRR